MALDKPIVAGDSSRYARCATNNDSHRDLLDSVRNPFQSEGLFARFARERPRRPIVLGSDCLYACGFRIYFTPLPGFFSPFPHGTGSLSVDHEYLALEDGPPMFRQGFTCPALLVVRSVPPIRFRVRGYHPLWPDFPDRSANKSAITHRLLRFRSPLLSESRLISFPAAT